MMDTRAWQFLDAIEPGLTLLQDRVIEKKRSGRKHRELDILCRDPKGAYVVVELKRRDVKARHIVGQIIEYMGQVKMEIAGDNKVRGYIIVGEVWPEIRFARSIVPGLDVKTLAEVLGN